MNCIQIKPIHQYFHVVLFIMYQMALTFKSVFQSELCHPIPVFMLWKVVLAVKSVDETLNCDHAQGTKKFRSDSPGLVNFVVGLVEFIFHLPDGQVKVFREFFL